jgi:hypothetical protein
MRSSEFRAAIPLPRPARPSSVDEGRSWLIGWDPDELPFELGDATWGILDATVLPNVRDNQDVEDVQETLRREKKS